MTKPRRPARWNFPEIDPERARWLSAQLKVAPLTARILVKRGYADPESARRFLQPSLDSLHDPFLMKGMDAAAQRLLQAVRNHEKILLYGDYDVDGTTSIVLLSKVLQMAGIDAGFHVPHRLKDGYGMRLEVIKEAALNGTRLIVSVDTGIRANEVVKYARELGVDVIVTDHHLPEAEIPPAVAVLNPNQPGCEYPEKNLCGAGVAFKLVQALLRLLEIPPARVRRLTESFLKIVAIATVAALYHSSETVKIARRPNRSARNPQIAVPMNRPTNNAATKLATPVVPKKPRVVAVKIPAFTRPGAT